MFDFITLLLSATSGLISVLLTLISMLIAYRMQRVKLRETRKRKLQSVLDSDDIVTIGHYFNSVVGKFNIYEYVANEQVAKTVDSYLDRLQLFVGTDVEVKASIEEIEAPKVKRIPIGYPDEFYRFRDELGKGEIWNGLAGLRRYTEIYLRNTAARHKISFETPSSAGRLLNLLRERKVISKRSFMQLRYAVDVCNKAVHGYEVAAEEAEKALYHAFIALRTMEKKETGT